MSAKSPVRILAEAVLRSDWFHRRQAMFGAGCDESWCDLCDGRGGYHDYGLDWHDADCPIRLACEVLRTTEPLDKHNDLMGMYLARRERRRSKKAVA